jgi:hypothetical protein
MTRDEYDFFAGQLKLMRKRQAIVIGMIAVGLVLLMWRVIDAASNARRLALVAAVSQSTLTKYAELKAKQDLTDQTYIKYINEVVNQMWDKLQEDNPEIDVPQPIPLRPPGLPEVTRYDLERPKKKAKPDSTPAPSASPSPVVKYKTKYRTRYRTRSFWESLFKPNPNPTPRRR